ncbi:MAG: response regulator [Pirellulaceae bacterium]|nr:response regulator [Pirellulaceae bacterium]
MVADRKRVLDVGNCALDHGAIRQLLESRFQAEVRQAHDWEDARRQFEQASFDLVLVNRILDRDGSQGLDVIRRLKADQRLGNVPVMLITNFEHHQQSAVAAGAAASFGKRQLNDAGTLEALERYLGS